MIRAVRATLPSRWTHPSIIRSAMRTRQTEQRQRTRQEIMPRTPVMVEIRPLLAQVTFQQAAVFLGRTGRLGCLGTARRRKRRNSRAMHRSIPRTASSTRRSKAFAKAANSRMTASLLPCSSHWGTIHLVVVSASPPDEPEPFALVVRSSNSQFCSAAQNDEWESAGRG